MSDITHTVAAAASSSSLSRAQEFLSSVNAPATAVAYDSYTALVTDPRVDVVYVATPHSHHFANCLLALQAEKHVVCEKPFTVNASQLEILIRVARGKKRFLMEAVWTRFFPLAREVGRIVREGTIGEVRRVNAELNLCQHPEVTYADGNHRMVNPDLAGGALLDLGLYPLTWVFMTLYHTLPPFEKPTSAPAVIGTISRFEATGVDAENVVVLTFPRSIGVASSGIRVASDPQTAIRICGTKGEIQVQHPAYRPESYTLIKDGEATRKEFPIPGGGHGMFWEADEAARAIRDGKLECNECPVEESLLLMKAMDKVRLDNGFRYPEAIEKTDY